MVARGGLININKYIIRYKVIFTQDVECFLAVADSSGEIARVDL